MVPACFEDLNFVVYFLKTVDLGSGGEGGGRYYIDTGLRGSGGRIHGLWQFLTKREFLGVSRE